MDPLQALREATSRRAETSARADAALAAWKEAIRAAIADGQPKVKIADAAGISRSRLYRVAAGDLLRVS